MLRRALIWGALALFPTTLPAQQGPACTAAVYRQFDFWLGEWTVLDADGVLQGTNRIAPILGGCALEESWRGTGPSRGHSHSAYDGSRGRWQQSWVDNQGVVLVIQGGWRDGSMVLEGEGRGRDGGEIAHRITWTPLKDGRVRQHWQTSQDGGATWSDAFLGFYERKG